MVVQLDPSERASLENLVNLPIATPREAMAGGSVVVPLSQIARVEQGVAPAQIDRSDLERVATVGASTAPGAVGIGGVVGGPQRDRRLRHAGRLHGGARR